MKEESVGNIFGMEIKAKELTLWEKVRLFFAKPIVSCDYGEGDDKDVCLVFKKIGDKIYLVEEKETR